MRSPRRQITNHSLTPSDAYRVCGNGLSSCAKHPGARGKARERGEQA